MSDFSDYLGSGHGEERLLSHGGPNPLRCCGPPSKSHDASTTLWRLRWWNNVYLIVIAGLLVWVGVATSAMGYGLISTQPQLERTTSYTHSMKVSTEGAINGTTHFIQQRLAEFPANQVDVWLRQLSDSLASVTRIAGSIDRSVHETTSETGINNIVHVAVSSLVGELVPANKKASVAVIVDDFSAVAKKMRLAMDMLTADEIAQGFRAVSQLSQDTDEVVSAIKSALAKRN